MLHLVKEGELAGNEGSSGQKVQPLDLPCPPVDIIRAEHLEGLVEPGLLFQPLESILQQAAALSRGDNLLEHHAVPLIQLPEERLGELLHLSHCLVAIDLNDQVHIALSQDELASGCASEEQDKVYIPAAGAGELADEIL